MKSRLSADYIKVKTRKVKKCHIELYQAEVNYMPTKDKVTSEFLPSLEDAVKQALEELEWKVYYNSIMNNSWNRDREVEEVK